MAAKNSGKEWTEKEIIKLRRLARQNIDTDDIAKELERTKNAIYIKASRENISLNPKDKKIRI